MNITQSEKYGGCGRQKRCRSDVTERSVCGLVDPVVYVLVENPERNVSERQHLTMELLHVKLVPCTPIMVVKT